MKRRHGVPSVARAWSAATFRAETGARFIDCRSFTRNEIKHVCCRHPQLRLVGLHFLYIEGLNEWYDKFDALSYEYDEIEDDFPEEIIEEEITDESKRSALQETREWHICGYKLAQEVRKRLPLNVILIYQQSWDVANGLRYYDRDKGRIIFDIRKLKVKQN